jgi:hypothetical protein
LPEKEHAPAPAQLVAYASGACLADLEESPMSDAQNNSGTASVTRAILGVVAGALVWIFGFLVLAQILVLLWPAYAVPARTWTRTGTYTFTALMSVINACFWILVEIATGWVAAVIARRSRAVWVLAALVMVYLCFLHLFFAWQRFPWWYNLVVAISSGPAILLGGRLGATRVPAGSPAQIDRK